MAKRRIAIVGFGKIARDQHAPAIAASDEFELVAVSNVGGGALPDGVASFAGYAELLRQAPEVEAVAICTPPGPRRTIAADCLAAGRHVLLEKPPAATLAELADLERRARAAGKVAFAAYHSQFKAGVKPAAARLAGKAIRSLDVTWQEDVRRWHPNQDWVMVAGGFGVFDPGINALSILHLILPQPIFIGGASLDVPANRQAPIAARLTFATGGNDGERLGADFDWRKSDGDVREIGIETTDGLRLQLLEGGARLEVDGQPVELGEPDEYGAVYRAFAALLAAGRCELDPAPLQLVADAFMVGERTTVAAFTF